MPSTKILTVFKIIFFLTGCASIDSCKERKTEKGGDFQKIFSHGVVTLKQAPQSLRYEKTTCVSDYQFHVDSKVNFEPLDETDPQPEQGLRFDGRFTTRPGGTRDMIIRNGEISIAHTRQDIVSPGNSQPEGTYADILLDTDGRGWTEVDGPTGLWSAFGSFAGLAYFFPALPEATPPGSEGKWNLVLHRHGSGMGVEARRGKAEIPAGVELPEPVAQSSELRVKLNRWWTISDTPVAEIELMPHEFTNENTLSMADVFGNDDASNRTINTVVRGEVRARYFVTARGVVLYASVELKEHTTTSTSGRDDFSVSTRTHAEARLVASECEVPLTRSVERVRTATERALDKYTTLRNAVYEHSTEDVLDLFSKEVLQAHDRAAIVSTLEDYMQRHGPLSLGITELPHEASPNRLRLGGNLATEGDNLSVHVLVITTEEEGEVRIQSIGIDSLPREEGWKILEVSPSRLHAP